VVVDAELGGGDDVVPRDALGVEHAVNMTAIENSPPPMATDNGPLACTLDHLHQSDVRRHGFLPRLRVPAGRQRENIRLSRLMSGC
jgi:hypothetical protein